MTGSVCLAAVGRGGVLYILQLVLVLVLAACSWPVIRSTKTRHSTVRPDSVLHRAVLGPPRRGRAEGRGGELTV